MSPTDIHKNYDENTYSVTCMHLIIRYEINIQI